MATAILGLVTALFAAIPAILNVLEGRKARRHDMAKHSTHEFLAGVERMRDTDSRSTLQ